MWPLKLTHPISNSHSSIMRPLNRICKKWTATIKTKHYIIQKCVGGRTFWSSRKFFKDSTVLKLISRDTARKSKIFVGIWARCSSSDDDKSLFSCQMTLPVSASRKIIQFLQNTIDSRYINGTTITMKKTEAKQSNLHLETIADFFCKIFVSVTTHCLHTKISMKKGKWWSEWLPQSNVFSQLNFQFALPNCTHLHVIMGSCFYACLCRTTENGSAQWRWVESIVFLLLCFHTARNTQKGSLDPNELEQLNCWIVCCTVCCVRRCVCVLWQKLTSKYLYGRF